MWWARTDKHTHNKRSCVWGGVRRNILYLITVVDVCVCVWCIPMVDGPFRSDRMGHLPLHCVCTGWTVARKS